MSDTKKAKSAADYQAQQLAKLLKDPNKAVYIPDAPKEKKLRAPQEMMKNVQGSSAGAGSGEFHVYKQSRRREYERLEEMEREDAKRAAQKFSEEKAAEVEMAAQQKLAKNQAKRARKKKNRKGGGKDSDDDIRTPVDTAEPSLKKRRLIGGDGKGLTFRAAGTAGEEGHNEDGYTAVGQLGQDDELDRVPVSVAANTISIVDND